MNKQDAIDFIVEQFDQGVSPSEIARGLGKQLNAPYEVALKFVTRTLEQRMAMNSSPAPARPTGMFPPPPAPPTNWPPPVAKPAPVQSAWEPAVEPMPQEANAESSPAIPDPGTGYSPASAWETPSSKEEVERFGAAVFLTGRPPEEQPAEATSLQNGETSPALSSDETGFPAPSSATTGEIDPKLEKFIVDALSKDKKFNDVVMAVCEQTGVDWASAQRLVGRVQAKNRKKLTSRRNVYLVPFAIILILAGIALVAAGIEQGIAYAQYAKYMADLYTNINGNFQPVDLPPEPASLTYVIGYLVSGVGFIGGGSYGLYQALRAQFE